MATPANVPIQAILPWSQYAGDAIQQAFPFAWWIDSTDGIDVYLDDAQLIIGSDYTVALATPPTAGGTVTIPDAPLAGEVVTLVRNMTIARVAQYAEGGQLLAYTLNLDQNAQTSVEQQLDIVVRQALRLAPWIDWTALNLLLEPAPGNMLRWAADGSGIENAPFDATIARPVWGTVAVVGTDLREVVAQMTDPSGIAIATAGQVMEIRATRSLTVEVPADGVALEQGTGGGFIVSGSGTATASFRSSNAGTIGVRARRLDPSNAAPVFLVCRQGYQSQTLIRDAVTAPTVAWL